MPDVSTTKRERILLSAAEVAGLLGVSLRHFYGLLSSGRVGPLPVRLGRCIRWRRGEIEQWVQAGCPGRETWVKNSEKSLQSAGSEV